MMKKLLLLISLMLGMMTASAQTSTFHTETVEYNDSNEYGPLSMRLEMPVADNVVGKTIRQNLWNELISRIGTDLMYDGETKVPQYSGSVDNLQAMCNYYGSNAMKMWTKMKSDEYKETKNYILSSNDMTAEEKKEALQDLPHFGMDMNLKKEQSNARYIVFKYDIYGDGGGAHGGMYGNFYVFNAKTGKEVKQMLRTGVTRAMQPLLKKGLKKYFNEDCDDSHITTDRQLMEYLQIEGNTIPLPSMYNICPVKGGLLFTYGQYEIAAYAAGMPSFVLTYAEVKPYLTPEAKNLLGIK